MTVPSRTAWIFERGGPPTRVAPSRILEGGSARGRRIVDNPGDSDCPCVFPIEVFDEDPVEI